MLLEDMRVNKKALKKLQRWHNLCRTGQADIALVDFLQNEKFVSWLKEAELFPEKIETIDQAFEVCGLFALWRLYSKDLAGWAVMQWGSTFSPEPMTVRLVWDALEKYKLVNVMGASSTGKTYTALVYALARYALDPQWTRVDVIGSKKTLTMANAFSQLQNLFRSALFKLPGKSEGTYIGIDRKYGQGIFVTTIEGDGSDIRGIQLLKRTGKPHVVPEIGEYSSHIVILDELQQIDVSIFQQVSNLMGKVISATDTWHRKIFASANPQFVDSQYGQICKPMMGWGSIDETSNQWKGEKLWHVVRLNATLTENYKIIDELNPTVDSAWERLGRLVSSISKQAVEELSLFKLGHGSNADWFLKNVELDDNLKATLEEIVEKRSGLILGLQSWDAVQEEVQRAGGDWMSAHVYTFCYGMFPPSGSFGSVIRQDWMTKAEGEYIFTDLTSTAAGFDLGFNHDLAVGCFVRYGRAIGWKSYSGKEYMFGTTPEVRHESGVLITPAKPVTKNVVQIESMIQLPSKVDSAELADEIKLQCEMRGIEPSHVAIDATGVGEGCYAYLKRHWSPDVIPIDYRHTASEDFILQEDTEMPCDVYNMMVSELWYALAKWLEVEVVKFSRAVDQETLTQLTGRMADHRRGSGRKMSVETKDLYKARGNKSPDKADAVTLAIAAVRKNATWLPTYITVSDNTEVVLSNEEKKPKGQPDGGLSDDCFGGISFPDLRSESVSMDN